MAVQEAAGLREQGRVYRPLQASRTPVCPVSPRAPAPLLGFCFPLSPCPCPSLAPGALMGASSSVLRACGRGRWVCWAVGAPSGLGGGLRALTPVPRAQADSPPDKAGTWALDTRSVSEQRTLGPHATIA